MYTCIIYVCIYIYICILFHESSSGGVAASLPRPRLSRPRLEAFKFIQASVKRTHLGRIMQQTQLAVLDYL